jgi:large subunit ribosomal protein L6
MSKLGIKPIIINKDVTVKQNGNFLSFEGKKGKMEIKIIPYIKVDLADNQIKISPTVSTKQSAANWGTMASLIMNAMKGVSEGFSKTLIIEGVGYRAALEGNRLVLNLGFSHPVNYEIPSDIKIEVEKNTIIRVFGVDKEKVGKVASDIRNFKKPEPYKGKGIHYDNEVIRRKVGKKVAGATAS